MKRTIALILLICTMFGLSACGVEKKSPEADEGLRPGNEEKQPQSTHPTEEGWLMSRVDMPVKALYSVGIDNDGDWLWLSGCSETDGAYSLTLLGLDTISGEWRQFNIGLSELELSEGYDLSTVNAYRLSVKDGTAWMITECSSKDRALITARLVTVDTATGSVGAVLWDTDAIYQSQGTYTCAFAALGADRAVLIGSEEVCVIDRSGKVLSRSSIQAHEFNGVRNIGGQLYLISYEGIAPFDTDRLALGDSLCLSQGLGDVIAASSQAGNILFTTGGKLYSMDFSGQTALVFDWMDVALSRDTAAPYHLFENSKGEYYGYAPEAKGSRLVKVTRAQIPIKDTLTMACFFNTQSVNGETRMSGDMTDAILAYNNSDAEYKIEPVCFEYAGAEDMSRALIEAFHSDIDLVDQSNLPENSISGAQLIDLLPYIDAGTELSREDFFPSALRGMSIGGHMYRVSPYFSAMGLSVPMGLYPGAEDWSCEALKQAIANDPSLAMGRGKNRTQDYVVKAIAYAMTGEFIDLDSMSCDFMRSDFAEWLELLSALIDDTGLSEDRISFTCGVDSYYSMRAFYASYGMDMGYSGQIVGFPDSKGSGFYLASPAAVVAIDGEFKGMNTSVSIAKGCKAPEAAWGFVKLLLSKADRGIPVLKSAFNELTDYNSRAYKMAQEDIEALRYIAEDAAGTVLADEAVIRLVTGELNAYIAGDKTAQTVAESLQSRVSLYLSEQG